MAGALQTDGTNRCDAPIRVFVGLREPPPGTTERAGIDKVLQAPFSLIYAVSRVLIWTNQTTQTWNRPHWSNEETERLVIISRIKQSLQNPDHADEVRRYTEIAQSMLHNAGSHDMTLAFNIVGECWQETIAVSQTGATSPNNTLDETTRVHRDLSFCAHVVARRASLDVPNFLNDDTFRWHPNVVEGFRVRSYFGLPMDVLGQTIGSFCAFSAHGFNLSDGQREGLRQLASLLATRLERMILRAS